MRIMDLTVTLLVAFSSLMCVSSGLLKTVGPNWQYDAFERPQYHVQDLRHKLMLEKRMTTDAKRSAGEKKLFFKGSQMEEETIAAKHDKIVLKCEVGGSPSPTIHWLKDSKRIKQGISHDYRDDDATYESNSGSGLTLLRLGHTKSKLYLDCIGAHSEGTYTCVAETSFQRISQSTVLKIENDFTREESESESCMDKRGNSGKPARIFLWTATRLEIEGVAVQLFCRAEGYPLPEVTWLDRSGKPIKTDTEHYKILRNGDLVIRDISWRSNMGTYTCIAENPSGSDTEATFVYPTVM